MIQLYAFLGKYIFTVENAMAVVVFALAMLFMKSDADLTKLKNQAIAHGFAKYDEYQGHWRWITEEDMCK